MDTSVLRSTSPKRQNSRKQSFDAGSSLLDGSLQPFNPSRLNIDIFGRSQSISPSLQHLGRIPPSLRWLRKEGGQVCGGQTSTISSSDSGNRVRFVRRSRVLNPGLKMKGEWGIWLSTCYRSRRRGESWTLSKCPVCSIKYFTSEKISRIEMETTLLPLSLIGHP